jgi:hypothetical protein
VGLCCCAEELVAVGPFYAFRFYLRDVWLKVSTENCCGRQSLAS